jgi:hypothetical protein
MRGSDIEVVSSSGRERRVHHRVPYSSQALLRAADKVYAVRCVNLSLGGAALRTPPGAELADDLRLSFDPDGGQRFSVRAELVRAEGGVLCVRFVEFEQRALVSLLAEVAKSEPPPPPPPPSLAGPLPSIEPAGE